MSEKVTVIGAGGWGTATAIMLAKKGFAVKLWARRTELSQQISTTRENTDYLPGVVLPANIEITSDLDKAAAQCSYLVLATPTKAIRETITRAAPHISDDTVVVSLSKGLERSTLLRCSQVIAEVLGSEDRVAVLSGPNHAEEVARDIPTATVAAAYDLGVAEMVQDLFMAPKFRVYTNSDIIGVELAGALKNIIALGAGICDGLGFGDNTKAALMTRGIAEITRLGVAMGANPLTFAGLAGIGDLIVTCTSKHSRNWRAGYALGRGETLEQVMERTGMVVEGVYTTEVAAQLAEREQVVMPITAVLKEVLFEGKSPQLAVTELMVRDKTDEAEDLD